MKNAFSLSLVAALCIVLCGCSMIVPRTSPEEARASVGSLIEQFPADSFDQRNKLASEIIELGPAAIEEICAQLQPPGGEDDTKHRFALGGLAHYVSREGAEKESRMFSKALLRALESEENAQVQSFLIGELQLTAGEDAVQPLLYYVSNPELTDPAARALAAIGTQRASNGLTDAARELQGEQLAAVIQALGEMQSTRAANELGEYVSNDDPNVRSATLYLLANTGSPQAHDHLVDAANSAEGLERDNLLGLLAILGHRLIEKGQSEASLEVADTLLAIAERDNSPHVYAAGLSLYVNAEHEDSLPYLIEASNHKEHQVREAALKQALRIEGRESTDAWTKEMQAASATRKAEILEMLGDRGDASALPAVSEELNDDDVDVQIAAVGAIDKLAGDQSPDYLLDLLKQEPGEDVITAIKGELARQKGEDVLEKIANQIPTMPAESKIALINVLSDRHATGQKEAVITQADSDNEKVREAALEALANVAEPEDMSRIVELMLSEESKKARAASQESLIAVAQLTDDSSARSEALLNAYGSADLDEKSFILATLPKVASDESLELVIAETKSENEDVRDAAIRALAEWPSQKAMPELMTIIKEADQKLNYHVLAMRGYVQLVGESDLPPIRKFQRLEEAMSATRRDDEKRIIISALGNVQTIGALRLVEPSLSVPALQKEAAVAAADISMTNEEIGWGLSGDFVVDALERAIPLISNEEKKKAAKEYMDQITAWPSDYAEDDFTSLFNGKDLTGWIGATDAYEVKGGVLVAKADAAGDIFAEKEYDDFVLRFEFLMPEGGNNGVGIRAPLATGANDKPVAFRGIEIQMLDNDAEKYKDIKDYQTHGSVYGIAPGKRGFLKRADEWNREEIVVDGDKIRVILNGETISEADLSKDKPLDGQEHPGMYRRSGYVGFLGHHSPVKFRNIRIREIPSSIPEGYVSIFNGEDLSGWHGLAANPNQLKKLGAEEVIAKQHEADEKVNAHWEAGDGVLYHDGEWTHIHTEKEYGDFDLLMEWKIVHGGDSGVYVRGVPQVQIWDPADWLVASGGLYNNQTHPSEPDKLADNPPGTWNTFRIKMVGEKTWVWLNGELVVDGVVLENYWNRSEPVPARGPIELQSHGSPLWFRNIYIKEL